HHHLGFPGPVAAGQVADIKAVAGDGETLAPGREAELLGHTLHAEVQALDLLAGLGVDGDQHHSRIEIVAALWTIMDARDPEPAFAIAGDGVAGDHDVVQLVAGLTALIAQASARTGQGPER